MYIYIYIYIYIMSYGRKKSTSAPLTSQWAATGAAAIGND